MAASDSDFQIKVTSDTAAAQADLKALADKTDQFGSESQTAGDKASAGYNKADAGANALVEHLRQLETIGSEIFAVDRLVDYGGKLIELADNYAQLIAQIKSVTTEQGDYSNVAQAVLDIAQKTAQPLDAVGDAYVRIASGTKNLNLSQQQQLDITQTLIEAYKLNGVGAQEASGQIAALAKSLSEGTVTGKGFVSAIENTPQLADAIAQSLGVTRAEMLELAKAGKLSADEITTAILSAKDAIDKASAAMPDSVKEAITRLNNSFESFVGQSAKVGTAAGTIREAIDGIGSNFDALETAATRLAEIGLAKLALSLVDKMQAFIDSKAAIAAETAAQIENAQANADAAIAAQDLTAAQSTLAKVNYDLVSAQQAQAQAALAAAQADADLALANEQGAIAVAEAAAAAGDNAEAVTAAGLAAAETERTTAALAAAQRDATLVAAKFAAVTDELVLAQNAEAAAAEGAAAAEEAAAATRAAASKSILSLGSDVKSLAGATQLAFAAVIGYDIGGFLYKNFETARIAGNLLAEGLVDIGATAEAAFKIISHPLDAEQIWGAYQQQLKDIDANFQVGRDTAKDFGDKAKQAGTDAAAGAETAAAGMQKPLVGLDLLLVKYGLVSAASLKSGNDTDDLIKKLQALSETKLSALADELDAAFTTGTISAAQFSTTLADLRTAQLQKLGVDAAAVSGQIHQAMTDAITTVKSLGTEAGTTSAQITAAFDAALSKATTQEDAQALIAAVGDIKVAGFDAAAALKEIADRTKALPTAAESVSALTQAYKDLGIVSAQALQDIATKAEQAYEALQNANVPVGVLDQAFTAMASKTLDAAAAQGDVALDIAANALRAQVANDDQSKSLDALIGKYPALADACEAANRRVVKSTQDAAQAIDDLFAKIDDAAATDLGSTFDAITAGFQQLSAGAGKAAADIIATTGHEYESLSDYYDELAQKTQALKLRFDQQTESAQLLTAQLTSAGGASAQLLNYAQRTAQGFSLLDSQTLSNLNAAISAAKANLDSLDGSAKQTLTDLQNQLDQLEGNTAAIQQRANDAQRATIEAQLQQAQALHDNTAIAQLQQSLDLLNKISQVQQAQAKASPQQTTTQTTTQPTTPSNVVQVNLNIAGTNTPINLVSQTDANALIQALKDAKLVSV